MEITFDVVCGIIKFVEWYFKDEKRERQFKCCEQGHDIKHQPALRQFFECDMCGEYLMVPSTGLVLQDPMCAIYWCDKCRVKIFGKDSEPSTPSYAQSAKSEETKFEETQVEEKVPKLNSSTPVQVKKAKKKAKKIDPMIKRHAAHMNYKK